MEENEENLRKRKKKKRKRRIGFCCRKRIESKGDRIEREIEREKK